ncbi:hypothetical protein JFK97_11565 [Chromobacterium phragmitis]|uniref:hypothetical protein n=2 Tax=Chromobacterium amazonense TaxID=1382803 RepID=UPI0021B82C6E|nr:hypothetical protein [Chromobacterium amazonense]MBM2885028.1 hypothetical protein [Chromobacterium amazonense]
MAVINTSAPSISWNAFTRKLVIGEDLVNSLRHVTAQSQGYYPFCVNGKEYRANMDKDGKIQVLRNWEGSGLISRLFRTSHGHCSAALTEKLNEMSLADLNNVLQPRRERNPVYAENFSRLCAELKNRVGQDPNSEDLHGLFRVRSPEPRLKEFMDSMETSKLDSFDLGNIDLANIVKRSKPVMDILKVQDIIAEHEQEEKDKKIAARFLEALCDSYASMEQKQCKENALSTMAFCYSHAKETGEFSKKSLAGSMPLFDMPKGITFEDAAKMNVSVQVPYLTAAVLSNWSDRSSGTNRPPVPPKPRWPGIQSGVSPSVSMGNFSNVVRELSQLLKPKNSA